jgi:hypothetical protein
LKRLFSTSERECFAIDAVSMSKIIPDMAAGRSISPCDAGRVVAKVRSRCRKNHKRLHGQFEIGQAKLVRQFCSLVEFRLIYELAIVGHSKEIRFRTMPKTAAAKVQKKILNETASGANYTGMSDP